MSNKIPDPDAPAPVPYRWYSTNAYINLISNLEQAEKGSDDLNRYIFLALGGTFKSEATSKQGGETLTLPDWRDGREFYLWSQNFSTSLAHVILQVEQFDLLWSVERAFTYTEPRKVSYLARVSRRDGTTSYTFPHDVSAIALSGALLRLILYEGVEHPDSPLPKKAC